ncbi:MAG: glucose 1-dehydrogenase [Gammaproteobacteria bacterium]|nr:MAG: glucose 1-dehydrogenase [Gammaproteobacteria bacterium]
MGKLSGKTAIITGGAQGMGAATARLFIEEGAKVVIGDVQDDKGKALAESLGTHCRYVHLDVTSESDWHNAVTVAGTMGPLNVLVNNAGILFFKSLVDTTVDDYLRLIRINQVGAFIGIRSVIAPMKEAGGGSIINISSIDGLQAKNSLSAYASSKWALRGLTKAAAIELGPYNIRVNTVHPGGINTDMGSGGADSTEAMNVFYKNHPLPRVGQPQEVARMSAFLASDESSYSTGSEFIVDGGWSAGMRMDILPTS